MKHEAYNMKRPSNATHRCAGSLFRVPSSVFRDGRGFTLMEVLVSVTIFAGTVTMMLSLFNTTLKIYRKIEAQRQISQSVRTTMEFLVKEIRNGQIDYNVTDGITITTPVIGCDGNPLYGGTTKRPAALGADSYAQTEDRIQLINVDGERECIYRTGTDLFLRKDTQAQPSRLNPTNVAITTFKLYIRPRRDPYTEGTTPLIYQQPSVTIVAVATVTLPTGEVRTISYQTSVASHVYDIPGQ